MTANDNDFWLKSGIRNTFNYEVLDSRTLRALTGFSLDSNNVESCTITESYESDTRISGTLELKGERPPEGCAIRINHTATLGDETQTETLGTFMIGSDSPKFMFGEYSGQLNLVSMLDRFSSDYAPADTAVSGQNACTWFENTVTDGGGIAWVNDAMSRTTKMSDWVWEFGTSVLSALFTCAETVPARVSVDTLGRITLEPYVTPSSVTPSYTVDGNTLEAGIERTDGDRINRVAVKYTPKDEGETKFAVARLAATHAWSYENLGRWLCKTYEVSQGQDEEIADPQAEADRLANYYMNLNDSTTHKWEGSGLYRPLSCGEVGTLSYQDTATGTPITHKVLLRQKEYTLDAAMETKYIFSQLD